MSLYIIFMLWSDEHHAIPLHGDKYVGDIWHTSAFNIFLCKLEAEASALETFVHTSVNRGSSIVTIVALPLSVDGVGVLECIGC